MKRVMLIIRVFLSVILLCGIYHETGIFTSLCLAFVMIGSEIISKNLHFLNKSITKSVMVSMVIATILLTGCTETQKRFGDGDPSAEYIAIFGNGNNARLNFMQSQELDRLRMIVYGFNQKQKDGSVKRKRGLIERVTALESTDLKEPSNGNISNTSKSP